MHMAAKQNVKKEHIVTIIVFYAEKTKKKRFLVMKMKKVDV